MQIESPAFEQHQPIPQNYTCEGQNISPPLFFKDVPLQAKSLALIMEDPDAPNGIFDHWIVWDIDPKTSLLNEKAQGLKEGKNSFGQQGYGGPCPPKGKPHRYYFKLYALDKILNLPLGSSKKDLQTAMKGHILGTSELMGTYQRQGG